MTTTATHAAAEVRQLFFSSGGERFAVDVAYVREVLPEQPTTPVPFVPDTVAGIINHRGTIYTLIRFSRLAHLREERSEGIVLLRLPEMAVGIIVERVDGIERLPGTVFREGGEAAEIEAVPFLSRVADVNGRLVHAVDAERLIDTIYQIPELHRAGDVERNT